MLHSSTGFAPNYLMNGIKRDIVPGEFARPSDLESDRRVACQRSKMVYDRNKANFDKNKKDETFEVGQKIYVEN